MKKIVGIVTTEFGFGPVSKASYIIREIKEKNPEYIIWFYGEEFSSVYIRKSNSDIKIIEYSKKNDEVMGLKNCSIVINVMNTEILQEWDASYPKMYFIDSLSWMWDKPIQGIEHIGAYYIQDYLTDYAKVNQYRKYTVVKLIPPISEKGNKDVEKKNLLLINFSGVHNPYTDSSYFLNYCITMMDCILKEAINRFCTIRVALNYKLASRLQEHYKNIVKSQDIEFNFYGHEEFISLVKEAEFIITNSGITTTLELCNYNRCYCYLLGTNYSQALMTQKYFDEYKMNNVLPLSQFGVDMSKIKELPEEEGVRVVTNTVTRILKDNVDDLVDYFKNMFETDRELISQNSLQLLPDIHEFGQKIIVNDLASELECC